MFHEFVESKRGGVDNRAYIDAMASASGKMTKTYRQIVLCHEYHLHGAREWSDHHWSGMGMWRAGMGWCVVINVGIVTHRAQSKHND